MTPPNCVEHCLTVCYSICERRVILENKILKAELVVDERLNKDRKPYSMLMIYVIQKDGKKVLIHELYLQTALQQIIEALTK